MTSKKSVEEHLVEQIKKSGYPLEIEISNLLDKGKYAVFNTQYYYDEETKQGRDIDIYAMPLECHPSEENLAPFNVRTELAVECKKSETHAWVFYTRPRIPVSSIYMSGQYRTSVPTLAKHSEDSFNWLLKGDILDLLYSKFERIAIAYDEVKEKKIEKEGMNGKGKTASSRREVFEASSQLVKFACYEMHQIFGRIERFSKPSSKLEHIVVFFPTIAFDGDMFEVSFESGEPKLEKKNHILLLTHHRCPYCQKVESFTVSIVHRSYFSEFMRTLEADFYAIRERMLQNYDKLIKSVRETRERYESETREGAFG